MWRHLFPPTAVLAFLPPGIVSISRNCQNLRNAKEKPPQRDKYEKNNRVLSSFHKHFHSDSIQELLINDLEAEFLFTVFRQGREDSIAVSVFVDISIEIDKSDGKVQITTLILSDEEPCLSPVSACFVFTIEAKIHFAI